MDIPPRPHIDPQRPVNYRSHAASDLLRALQQIYDAAFWTADASRAELMELLHLRDVEAIIAAQDQAAPATPADTDAQVAAQAASPPATKGPRPPTIAELEDELDMAHRLHERLDRCCRRVSTLASIGSHTASAAVAMSLLPAIEAICQARADPDRVDTQRPVPRSPALLP